MSDVSKTNELIAKLHNLANLEEFVDDALAELLSDAANDLEAATRERDEAINHRLAWTEREVLRSIERDDARAERDAALSRIAEAAKLHRKYTYYDLEDSCPDTTDEHREEHHHESDEIGEFYCDQMPTGDVVCDNCRDVLGDRMEWPCPTIAALGLTAGGNE